MASSSGPPAGVAVIKPEFVIPSEATKTTKDETAGSVHDGEQNGGNVSEHMPHAGEAKKETQENKRKHDDDNKKEGKKRKRGLNKSKDRPKPAKFFTEEKLCPALYDGDKGSPCPKLPECTYQHNVSEYLGSRKDSIDKPCHVFKTFGKCRRGLSCLFYKSHTDENNCSIVNEKLWAEKEALYLATHSQILPAEIKQQLRKRTFDFKAVEKICSSLGQSFQQPKTSGALTDEDTVPLRSTEMRKIDWKNKLYLAPLTTVGNLPFRRICVDFGADITCSEMSMASSLVQGNSSEYALHRRHPCEKIWGVQICCNNGVLGGKAAQALTAAGIDYDFIDMNCGCPLEPIYRQGAGSGLMCRTNKFQTVAKVMSTYLADQGKPFTMKLRTGIKMGYNTAHKLIPMCKDAGVSLITLHGRSREQRYLKTADWEYIGRCAKLAEPVPLFGNGDILSYEDYVEKMAISDVPGVMIGRGALMKPWIFQEIKEQRHIDLSSSQRMELVERYSKYGLEHWGSDAQGVSTTRRFLLEWLSFFHRYIPFGLLEHPPQRMNQRPPRYRGRDEAETLLASTNSADWVKLSEMFLGPVPDNFVFLPKHKANAWVK